MKLQTSLTHLDSVRFDSTSAKPSGNNLDNNLNKSSRTDVASLNSRLGGLETQADILVPAATVL